MTRLPASTLLIFLFLASVVSSTSTNGQIEELVEWVRSKCGGFVSGKVDIRRMDPLVADSPYGVFVRDDVDVNEVLLEVPKECYILVPEEELEQEQGDTAEYSYPPFYYRNVCRLAKLVQKELELGPEKSDFGPYIAYLQSQRPGQIPATWSKEGKDLLLQALDGDNLPPGSEGVRWIDNHFKATGCIDPENTLEEHVVAMAIQRGYDTALIPIWDMVNHANGKLNNLGTNSLHENIKVWASRPIKKGEELFASYNYCVDCMGVGDDWGMAGIFRDFGFVESYPHVWYFEERDLWFQIDEEGQSESKNLSHFPYWRDDVVVLPTEEDVAFLEEQQRRLATFSKVVKDRKSHASVPEHEWSAICQFVQAASNDIASYLAIAARDHGSSNGEL